MEGVFAITERSCHDSVPDAGDTSIPPSSLGAASSRSSQADIIANSTAVRSYSSSDSSGNPASDVALSATTQILGDIWRHRLATAERLILPFFGTKYVRKDCEADWIWDYLPSSKFYCVREKDTGDHLPGMFFSQSRCLRMVRFLQLCSEQAFPCDAQRRWLRMATSPAFDGNTALFKQFSRTLAMLVLQTQSFDARYPDKVPIACKSFKRHAAYYVEYHWINHESVKDNLMKHLDRLCTIPSVMREECGIEDYEWGSVEEPCICTLQPEISEELTFAADRPSTPARLCARQETLSHKGLSVQKAHETTLSPVAHGAVLNLGTNNCSATAHDQPRRSKAVRGERIRELYQKWSSSSVSWESILSTARAYGSRIQFIQYLNRLLPVLPCDELQGRFYVTAQGMDVVLGYFVLVLTEELTTIPMLPKDDPSVLEDLARTLDWYHS